MLNYLNTFRSTAAYSVPFVVFAAITYAGAAFKLHEGLVYFLKTVMTIAALYYYRNEFRNEIQLKFSWTALLAGIIVFLIWVLPDSLYPHIGNSEFNPYKNNSGAAVYFLIIIRFIGASLVVPIMEELFWRSFALRFLLRSDFRSVPLGTFSWFSFIVVSVAFGFEHHRWLAGIVAGMIFAWVLYRSKNLFEPILAHGVANFLLGIYVIQTGQWSFW